MNPLELTYCENEPWAYMAQPWNTISNAWFFVAAFALWFYIRRIKAVEDRTLVWLIVSITLIGACSTFWHATQYPWALLVDVFGIIVFAAYYIYYVMMRRLGRSVWQASFALIGVIVACVVAMKITDPYMVQRSGAFIPLSLIFFGAALKLWRHSKTDALYLVAAGVSMGLAIVARVMDVTWCDYFSMSTHAIGTHYLWHSLTALTAYLIMMPVIRSHR